MTLETSGAMSIGGTTYGRSINLELKRSATATSNMNETSLRDLADVSSGAISMSNFYGKSLYKWQNTITIGQITKFGQTFTGYSPNISGTALGSTTDTTCDLYSTAPTWGLYHTNNNTDIFQVYDTAGTPTGNAGWSQVHVYVGRQDTNSATFLPISRSGASYYTATGLRQWELTVSGFPLFSISDVWVTVAFKE
jgi:hypothetical protein